MESNDETCDVIGTVSSIMNEEETSFSSLKDQKRITLVIESVGKGDDEMIDGLRVVFDLKIIGL